MKLGKPVLRIALLWLAALLAGPAQAGADTAAEPGGAVRLLASGAFSAVHEQLASDYRKLGVDVTATFGPAMHSVPTSVPRRLEGGEAADVVLTSKAALAKLAAQGLVAADSQVDIMKSSLGMAVRSGSPIPQIATQAQTAAVLLRAESVAYSSSLSGTYYATEMLKQMGIEDRVLPKSRKISGEKVGAVVARGEAEIGIQQVSEILAVPGVVLVGKLPESIQRHTVFSAAISSSARNPQGARALIAFLARSPQAHEVLKKNGLAPAE